MYNKDFSFELITQAGDARLGKIFTPRGIVNTPAFMPVGTQGTVKSIFTDDVLKTGSEIILGNRKYGVSKMNYSKTIYEIIKLKLF